MDTTSRVRDLVAPLVTAAGARLYDIEFTRGILRVTVDRDGGVDMGTIGSLTRDISRLLDESDPVAGSFTLEVSSPGVERALRTPEHFEGAVGESVSIKIRSGVEGDRRVTGTLAVAGETTITVQPDDGSEARTLAYVDVERARTVFEWGPAPKPGTSKSPSAKNPSAKNPSAKKKAAKP